MDAEVISQFRAKWSLHFTVLHLLFLRHPNSSLKGQFTREIHFVPGKAFNLTHSHHAGHVLERGSWALTAFDTTWSRKRGFAASHGDLLFPQGNFALFWFHLTQTSSRSVTDPSALGRVWDDRIPTLFTSSRFVWHRQIPQVLDSHHARVLSFFRMTFCMRSATLLSIRLSLHNNMSAVSEPSFFALTLSQLILASFGQLFAIFCTVKNFSFHTSLRKLKKEPQTGAPERQ